MTIHLVRHGKAGSRRSWPGDDDERPLSKPGRVQARTLADQLATAGISRICSSPSLRCRETVAPLGGRLGVPVETTAALAEGASPAESLRLVEKVRDQDVVLCTHGDVLGNLLMHYSHLGVDLGDDRIEKASIWQLEVVHGEVTAARYVPAPRT